MEYLNVYVLTTLSVDAKDNIVSRNVGVTVDIIDAEAHKAHGVENDFETFVACGNWREGAEQSALIITMRDFREMVHEMHEAALR